VDFQTEGFDGFKCIILVQVDCLDNELVEHASSEPMASLQLCGHSLSALAAP
jgi:hypothetical protein